MCWIIGVYDIERTSKSDLPQIALNLLRWNKNRGQEWYGLSVVTAQDGIQTLKFTDLNDPQIYQQVHDTARDIIGIIWHARYPTSWGNEAWTESFQPFEIKTGLHHAFAFNGNIANAEDIAQNIEEQQGETLFQRPIFDTKVLEYMIRSNIKSWEKNTKRILENINEKIDGSCNIVLADSEWWFTLTKDRWGFRPVFHGVHEWNIYFSSESSALWRVKIHSKHIKVVDTGESIKFSPQSSQVQQSLMDIDLPIKTSHCFFETVYFADPKTQLWGETSSEHRYRLGQNLADTDRNTFSREDSVVIHVPASSKDSADGYADSLNLQHFEAAIFKNPDFDKRSFIAKTREERIEVLKKKYIFHPGLIDKIRWKKLILIDDSMVRWTTLEYLIEIVKNFFQSSEVHIRIPSPPIMAPCYYAINLRKIEELLANRFFQNPQNPQDYELERLAKHLWANSLRYINQERLIDALQVEVKDMCLWCISGNFPTKKGRELYAEQLQEISGNSEK